MNNFEDKFRNIEACEELCADLSLLEDTLKHIASTNEDCPDLWQAYGDVIGSCEDLVASYKHYRKV